VGAASSRCEECDGLASNKLGPSPPGDPASLTDQTLKHGDPGWNEARRNALECTNPCSDSDGLARAWGAYFDDRVHQAPCEVFRMTDGQRRINSRREQCRDMNAIILLFFDG
jgi:hypothetical protein